MAHDVFISYSSQDKAVADAACAVLEVRRIRCWIAPRDVLPGTVYAKVISAAIEESRVVVVVLSASANDSPSVMREVEWAASKGIPIIPLRIQDVPPSKSMEYLISRPHCVDALTPPLQAHLERLADMVEMLFTGKTKPPQSTMLLEPSQPKLKQRLADLVEEHEAVSRQLGYELDAANRIRLQRRLRAIECELTDVEQSFKESRITSTGKRIETKTKMQGRALDAALPRRVTVGHPTELVAQVRLITSAGLKTILRIDHSYQVRGRDVVSRCFEVEFPVMEEDKLGAGVLTLKVDAPDFDMSSRIKKLQVPPDGDSQVIRFLLTPKRAGKLVAHLEIYREDVIAASQAFVTDSEDIATQPVAEPAPYVIVSLPLITYSWSQTSMSGLPSAQIPSMVGPAPRPVLSVPARRASPLLAIVLLLGLVAATGGVLFVGLQVLSPRPGPTPVAMATVEPIRTPSAGAVSGHLKIAILAPLSGPVPTFGVSTRDGALLAIEEWNAKGGVLGMKIVPVIEDSQCTPDPAVSAANKVIEQDMVRFIVGEVCSNASIPISDIANARKVIQISPASTNENLTVTEDGKVKKYIFRACFINSFQGKIGAKFAVDNLKAKDAFIIVDQANDYAKDLAEEFEKAFMASGGKIVGKETYTADDTDFSVILANITTAEPDVVYLPDYYNIVNLVTMQAKENGIAATFVGGDGWESPDLNLEAAAGGYFTNHYAADSTASEAVAFRQAYGAAHDGAVPDAFAAVAYDAANLLLAAIENAGTEDTDKVRAAMEEIIYQGVTGRITFDAQHNPIKSVAILKVTTTGVEFNSVVDP